MQLEAVSDNYDRAASYYDRLTDLVFGRLLGVEKLRERAITQMSDRLGDPSGAVVLDVGCGTGRNFPYLVERVGALGRVTGVDYSAGMLDEARERVDACGWSNVELQRGDASTLRGVQGPVDAVVSVWCLGIVHDLEAALNRSIDLLRPGGQLAIMDFDRARPDQGPIRWLYPVYSRLLRWAGIDTAEDLDDRRLRDKWQRGRAVLEERLVDLREERYLYGTGFILWGAAPGA